jgi:uncharacterized protein
MSARRSAWLIIDGYSLLHRDPELNPLLRSNLAVARQLLIRKVERVAADLADHTTIVFDGKGGAQLPDVGDTVLEILFAPLHRTADTVIEQLVHADAEPARVLVVTSDRLERQTVEAAGADSMSCGDFLDRIRARTESLARPRTKRPDKGSSLGDFFPE